MKENIGLELHRLENFEEPLDSRPMNAVRHGVSELRQEDVHFWYRLFYWLNSGWIYVLHCFKKKTNKTSKGDIKIARQRIAQVIARKDPPAPAREQSVPQEGEEEEESA